MYSEVDNSISVESHFSTNKFGPFKEVAINVLSLLETSIAFLVIVQAISPRMAILN